ncbi:MAG TPA: type II toxin-antitoxin system HicB family antitoxin [Bryobacteraceae bacterium]|nr:type II toxin-antitoxin system HicB family antitoxin [Bryobacteraceae bacterium]
MRNITAYVEFDPATQLFVGVVPGLPGAHTQGATIEELRSNLKEVLELCLEDYEGSLDDLPQVVGVENVEVSG